MTDSVSSHLGYRPDIDGLRAISVLAVLGFHSGIPFCPGGFVGVDVFFVISGYLITSLLVAEHSRTGRISFPGFWARRVRRLAPALLFVLLGVLALGGLLLERISGEVGALARAAIATLGLNANHFFLKETGDYFGAAAETNPLLHMWSLSGEEQFYILWPIVLAMLLKCSQVVRIAIMGFGFAGSLALSTYLGGISPPHGFYLMPSRAWELLAGAMLVQTTAPRMVRWSRHLILLMGTSALVLIVGSVMFISGGEYFPGPLALFPVLGAVLLIAAGAASPDNFASNVMSFRPIVYIGKISYPLYLWHWPVLVIARSQRLYEPSLALDLISLLVSVGLAVFTFEVIEKGSWRFLAGFTSRKIISFGLGGSCLVLVLALLLGAWARFGWGYSDKEKLLDAMRKDLPSLDCMFPTGFPRGASFDRCYPVLEKRSILLLGDSHANHWRPALENASARLDLNLGVLAMNACRPIPGPVGTPACVEFNEQVTRSLGEWKRSRHLAGIVLSARWAEGTGTLTPSITDRDRTGSRKYYDGRASSQKEVLSYFESSLRTFVRTAEDQGLRLVIVLPSPVQRFAASHCLALKQQGDCNVALDEMIAYAAPTEEVIRRVANDSANVRLVDPKEFMCNSGLCPSVIDGVIGYTDDDHVSKRFSVASADRFVESLAWLVKASGSERKP